MLLTLAAAEAAAAAHGTTTTTALVCENGESAPVATLIIEPGMDLRRATGALVPGCEHGSCRVFDQLGFEVADAAAVADGQRLFLVPEWRHFIWPAFEVGHKAQWPGEVQVPRLPITLETLSVSPRVFRVTHFFDEFDADFLIENALGITHPQRMLQQSKTGAGNKVSDSCIWCFVLGVVRFNHVLTHLPFPFSRRTHIARVQDPHERERLRRKLPRRHEAQAARL